jgi:regulator of cell morphogenesis and NO signaling
MLHERGQVGPLLDRLRELTGGYTVPEGVGATWRALWDGLRALDHGLREHMRVEDEVLFPRVTAHG